MKDILEHSAELKGKPYEPSWQDKLARIMIPEMKEWEGKTVASCKKTVAFVEDLLKQAKLEVIESVPSFCPLEERISFLLVKEWKEEQKELIN